MSKAVWIGALAIFVVCAVWTCPASGGWGGGRSGASGARTRVDWENITLPTRTEPGYGERQLPPEEFARQSLLGGGDPKPVIVWFYSLEDDKANKTLETSTFADEPIALMMQVFRRIKIDVSTITDAPLRKKYGRTPNFVIIAPNAEVVGSIVGKSATSRSRFKGGLTKAWAKLYKTTSKAYLKAMTGILNRLDSVSGKKTVLNAKKARLAKRPNARKLAALEKEAAKLAELEREIEADEEEIQKRCVLKDKWLPAEGGEAEK